MACDRARVDLNLPDWGPYSKRLAGIAHIPDRASGCLPIHPKYRERCVDTAPPGGTRAARRPGLPSPCCQTAAREPPQPNRSAAVFGVPRGGSPMVGFMPAAA
jgi:hypothetical protein